MKESDLKILCEDLIKKPIEDFVPVSGGDINQNYRIDTKDKTYFCKSNCSVIGEDLLDKECRGLKVLSRHVAVPKVVAAGPQLLVLEWINAINPNRKFWQKLGVELAEIHKITSNKFGFEHSNYIGILPQPNELCETWGQFYLSQRLKPQLSYAVDKGLLLSSDFASEDVMERVIDEVCPKEPASLTHGDLWSGNILCDENSDAFFIDPCLSYAHREMDIAMSMLFGKFDSIFLDTYQNVKPLEPNFKNRLDIYQLYYLLAHLNMFGLGYKNGVLKILKKYFG